MRELLIGLTLAVLLGAGAFILFERTGITIAERVSGPNIHVESL